ncbi:MAG: putative oxidoreductase YcjS [bacterium ADurb.Bin429]|nr:MAG: putative oxidoreductase YcjS [bacterium ADurb.Bin429]
MMEPLRIAVIGAGAMGQGHCASIGRVPELRLTAVCDTHEDTVQAVGARFDVPAFTDVDALLSAGCADAVLVAVPHPLHAMITLPCMAAGLHVLCEKPLAETVSAADAMLASAREHGVAFAVMFQRRFDPAMRAAIAFARDGGIGPILRTALVVPEFRAQYYFDSNPWRATWRGEGGGVLLNQAAHLLDIFALVGGLPSSLYGRAETRLHDIEVEDTAEALLRYPDGGSGYIHCSTVEPPDGGVLEVIGERGAVRCRGGRLRMLRYPEGVGKFARAASEVWAKPPVEEISDSAVNEAPKQSLVLKNFARHILHGEPLWCDAASGLASLELANAITLSGTTGREVALPVDRAAYDALLAELREKSTYRKREMAAVRVTDPKLV